MPTPNPTPTKQTALTDSAITKAVREAQAAKHEIKLTDWDPSAPGLHIRVSPKGLRTWSLRCRNPVTGKMQTNRLGAYPKMGIADARRACRAAHDRVKQEGVNLTDERRAKKAAASNSGDTHTLKTLLDVYAKHAAKSFPENRGAIDNVYAPLLDKRMSELTKTEINMAALEYGLKKETKHYPNLAYRLLKHALRWATVNLAGINADLLNIQKPYRVPTRRERALSNAELNRLLLALSASKALHAKATKFLLLTATRLEETTHATWAEFDLANGVWTIPAARRKQPKPHVPAVELVLDLPKQAMEILTEMAKKPHTNTSWVFPNSNNNPLSSWDKETKKLQKASQTMGWHRHDLRRTAATMIGDLGYSTDVTEAILGHQIGGDLSRRYNQSKYRTQAKEALKAFADQMDEIERKARDEVAKAESLAA